MTNLVKKNRINPDRVMEFHRNPVRVYLAAFIFFASTTFAQNNASLSSTDGKVFRVIVNGTIFNTIPQAHVVMEKIMRDTLHLELEFENKKKFPAIIYLLEQGVPAKNKEFNYSVAYDNTNLKLNFTGVYDIIPLPDPLVPKKPIIDTSQKYKNNILGHFCELKEGKPLYYNNIPKNRLCSIAMPAEYLNYAALLLAKAEVPEQKYTIVENVCRNNCISVEQLNTLLIYVGFEIEKLKMVRIAYPSLVDPANKKNLEKSFKLESAVNELNTFLKTADEAKTRANNGCTKAASQMIIDNYAAKLAVFGTDAERFEAFKKGYSDLCYSTDQAELILNKFIHDREKLDAAKLMYSYCVEKENFLKVAELFSYKQTGSELKDFIDKQKD